MNVHDSELIAGLLDQSGYAPVADGAQPDVAVFSTCAVRENADNELDGNRGHLEPVKDRTPGMKFAVGAASHAPQLPQRAVPRDHPVPVRDQIPHARSPPTSSSASRPRPGPTSPRRFASPRSRASPAAFTFQYSPRPGTPGTDLPPLPREVVQERYERLIARRHSGFGAGRRRRAPPSHPALIPPPRTSPRASPASAHAAGRADVLMPLGAWVSEVQPCRCAR